MPAGGDEHDKLSVQIQQLHKKDQSIALSMRGSKFRKLRKGRLVIAPAACIRRKSSHFADMHDDGVQIITGCNGWLWIGALDPKAQEQSQGYGRARPFGGVAAGHEPEPDFEATAEQWHMVARYATAAQALAQLRLPLFADALKAVVDDSLQQQVRCPDMLGMTFLTRIVGLEEERRGGGGAGMDEG